MPAWSLSSTATRGIPTTTSRRRSSSSTPVRAGPMAAAAPDAAAAGAPPAPPPPPPYAAPLSADARRVVRDASLGVTARVVGERLSHKRYLATYDRVVRFTRPAGAVVGEQAGAAATVAATCAPAAGDGGAAAAVDAAAPAATTTAPADEQHHDVTYDVIGHPRCEFRFAVVFPYHPPAARAAAGAQGAGAAAAGAAGAAAAATAGGEQPGPKEKEHDDGDVTLVREYAHGPHRFVYTLPSGQFERHKHGSGSSGDDDEGGGANGGGTNGGIDLAATARAELEEEARLEGGEWHRLVPDGHPGIPEVKWCANAFEPFLCVGPTPHPAPPARDGEEEAAGIEAVRVPLREFRRLAASGEMLLPSVATGWIAIERLKALGLVRAGF